MMDGHESHTLHDTGIHTYIYIYTPLGKPIPTYMLILTSICIMLSILSQSSLVDNHFRLCSIITTDLANTEH